MTRPPSLLLAGTHRRAHRADPEDIAFGIYAFRLDPAASTHAGMTQTLQPGWLAADRAGRFVYAVNEVRDIDGKSGGAVSAFAIDMKDARLRPLNNRPTPAMPCHCSVDASGRFLVVATFGGGSVHLFALEDDGSIGDELDCQRHAGSSIHPTRQAAPHAHAAAIHPGNRLVLVPDLGTDQLHVYWLDDRAGRLVPIPEHTLALPPGSGPRHLAFEATGTIAYLINEMSASVALLSLDPETGEMAITQTVELLPEGFAGHRSGAAIALHPGGGFLYATTRSHGSSGEPPVRGMDSLVWFKIGHAGRLELQGRIFSGGEIPRDIRFDPDSGLLHVAHQASGTIVPFAIADDGTPSVAGPAIPVPVPVCVLILEGGKDALC